MDVQAVIEQIKLKQQAGEPLTNDEQVLAQMTPEQLHQVAMLGELKDKRDQLKGGKMADAQALINQGLPDNGSVSLSSGTSFNRGPTKADYMADAIRKGVGAYQMGQARKRDTKLMKKQTAGRQTWMDAALRQQTAESGARSGVPSSIARPPNSPPLALSGQPTAPQEPTLEEKLRKFGINPFSTGSYYGG